MAIKVEKKIDFEGEATAELLGLPANTSTKPEPLKFTKDSTELVFPIKIDQTAQARRLQDVGLPGRGDAEWRAGDAHVGNGRIAGRRAAAAQAGRAATRRPTATSAPPQPQPAAAEPPKRLSRLEQLRLERAKQNPGAGSRTVGGFPTPTCSNEPRVSQKPSQL